MIGSSVIPDKGLDFEKVPNGYPGRQPSQSSLLKLELEMLLSSMGLFQLVEISRQLCSPPYRL